MSFDLIVLGGGVGGYTGAIRAAKRGLNVALIEERDLGGTCLNRGCIPVKTLLHSSEVYAGLKDCEELGIKLQDCDYDQDKIYLRKQAICTKLREGVESLVKANKITYFHSHGQILDSHTVEVNGEKINANFILLATGSSPARLNILGIENTLNSDDVLNKPIEVQQITIIGGGVIGVELASYFSNLSKQVTIIEAEERILPMMSRDISVQLSAVLKKNGVKLVTSSKVMEILQDKTVVVQSAKGECKIEGQAVIVAIGRKSNLQGIGLENTNVKFDRFVKVDDNMRTNVENIFACGDIAGRAQLAHFAGASAITAVETMLGEKPSVDLSVVPYCVYTNPQIAVVGCTELKENFKQGKFMMGANGKSLIQGSNRGFVKVVVDGNDTVVGAEIFAVNATEILGELVLAVEKKMKLQEIASVIHAHPTIMEGVCEACHDIFGLATHKI